MFEGDAFETRVQEEFARRINDVRVKSQGQSPEIGAYMMEMYTAGMEHENGNLERVLRVLVAIMMWKLLAPQSPRNPFNKPTMN